MCYSSDNMCSLYIFVYFLTFPYFQKKKEWINEGKKQVWFANSSEAFIAWVCGKKIAKSDMPTLFKVCWWWGSQNKKWKVLRVIFESMNEWMKFFNVIDWQVALFCAIFKGVERLEEHFRWFLTFLTENS